MLKVVFLVAAFAAAPASSQDRTGEFLGAGCQTLEVVAQHPELFTADIRFFVDGVFAAANASTPIEGVWVMTYRDLCAQDPARTVRELMTTTFQKLRSEMAQLGLE